MPRQRPLRDDDYGQAAGLLEDDEVRDYRVLLVTYQRGYSEADVRQKIAQALPGAIFVVVLQDPWGEPTEGGTSRQP